ncbi:unnamed protein product [Enterobius vermicularis]|uniref:Uncharacterized protein n=1 Tax=Enterobius vermicularis TaxID=51028 RepID=A0A0N4VNF3_ENTVE|nr:unnamed protein product [Enterobius vermicularis]
MEASHIKDNSVMLEVLDDQLRLLHGRLVNSLNEEILCYRQSVVALVDENINNRNALQLYLRNCQEYNTSLESDGGYPHSDFEIGFCGDSGQRNMTVEEDTANEIEAKGITLKEVVDLLLKIMMHSANILVNALGNALDE